MWALLHRGFCIEVCAAFMSCVHTQQIFCFIILQVGITGYSYQVGKTSTNINFIKKRIDGS
mgnify:CR=1 FL=1